MKDPKNEIFGQMLGGSKQKLYEGMSPEQIADIELLLASDKSNQKWRTFKKIADILAIKITIRRR